MPSLIALVRVESFRICVGDDAAAAGAWNLVDLMTSASSPLITSQLRTRTFSLQSMLMPSLLIKPQPAGAQWSHCLDEGTFGLEADLASMRPDS